MSYKHIPELAEMLTPPDNRFEMLRQRFEAMAKRKNERAFYWISSGCADLSRSCEREANVYQKCADELARVLAGETPPAPGEAWETKQENGK